MSYLNVEQVWKTLPSWFQNLKNNKRLFRYISNLSPSADYFELLKQPFVGIVIHDLHKYAYIIEFENSEFKVVKNCSSLDVGEYLTIAYNNQENKLVFDSTQDKKDGK
jgi:hypothetical protein